MFVLGMVGSLCYWRADNQTLQWWLRSVSLSCPGIVFCLLTCSLWNSINEEDWQLRYYLRSNLTAMLTIGALLRSVMLDPSHLYEAAASLTLYFLSSRSWNKAITCFETVLQWHDWGASSWLWTILPMIPFNWNGNAIAKIAVCYISIEDQLEMITGFGTSSEEHKGGVSSAVLTQSALTSLNSIGLAVACSAWCWFSVRSLLEWIFCPEFCFEERDEGATDWLLIRSVMVNLNCIFEAIAKWIIRGMVSYSSLVFLSAYCCRGTMVAPWADYISWHTIWLCPPTTNLIFCCWGRTEWVAKHLRHTKYRSWSCFGRIVISWWSRASKEIIVTGRIIGKSTTDSEMESQVWNGFGQMPVEGVVNDQFLGDTDEAGSSGGHDHCEIKHGNGGISDVVDCKETASKWLQYDNPHVFIFTNDRERIQLSLNLRSSVFELRRKIYGILHIPLNQWRLQSFGGKLLWDRRKLADYDIKDGGTLTMRLQMKGGGCKYERH